MAETSIRVSIDPSGAESGAKRVKTALNSVGTTAKKAGGSSKKAGDEINDAGKKAKRAARGVRDVDAALKREAKTARDAQRANAGLGSSFGGLRGAIGAIGAGLAAREVIQFMDANTNLQSRLRLVTDSLSEQEDVYGKLLNIANNTRTSVNALGDLYVRVQQNTKEMNLTNREALQVTEALSQSFALSGSSAANSSAAMVQFSQALAGGIVRAEEFNSLVENSPALISALSKELGVTNGQLRTMVIEGELTSRMLIDGVLAASTKLREDFQKLAPTIEGSFQVLQNNIQDFIAGTDDATGVSTALAEAIQLAADNVDVLALSLGGLVAIRLATMLASAATAAIALTTAMRGLTLASGAAGAAGSLALLLNPIGLLVGAGVALGAGLVALRSHINDVADVSDKTKTSINGLLDEIESGKGRDSDYFRGIIESAQDAQNEIAKVTGAIQKQIKAAELQPTGSRSIRDGVGVTQQSDTVAISPEVADLANRYLKLDKEIRAGQHIGIEQARDLSVELAKVGQLYNSAGQAAVKALGNATAKAQQVMAANKAVADDIERMSQKISDFGAKANQVSMTPLERQIDQLRNTAEKANHELTNMLDGAGTEQRSMIINLVDKNTEALQRYIEALRQEEEQRKSTEIKETITDIEAERAAIKLVVEGKAESLAQAQEIIRIRGIENEQIREAETALMREKQALDAINEARKERSAEKTKATDQIDALGDEQEAIQRVLDGRAANLELAKEQMRIEELRRLGLDEEANKIEILTETNRGLQAELERQIQASDSIRSSFNTFFMDSITGSESLKESFGNLLMSLAEMVLQLYVIKPLMDSVFGQQGTIIGGGGGGIFGTLLGLGMSAFTGGFGVNHAVSGPGQLGAMFADGGAFTNGIVQRATTFDMGTMGEAGPEAIMPLAKTSDGSLGIKAIGGDPRAANDNYGGGGTVINLGDTNITIEGNADEGVSDKMAAQIAKANEIHVKSLVDAGITKATRPGGLLNRRI